MLVLSRKPTETIHIGDDISITVLRLSASRVSLGIVAPPGVKVLRSEISPREPLGTIIETTRESAARD